MKAKKTTATVKKFTKDDHERLRSYFDLADSVADLIGPHCEIVVHSLENLEQSVVKIVNGHHTGRTLNSPITDLGLKMLRLYEKTKERVSKSYFTTAKSGGLMKSTTCIITGKSNNVIGLFCININLSLPFPEIISTLLPDYAESSLAEKKENFSTNPKDIIEQALVHAEKEVIANPQIKLKNRNKSIIHILFENGVFELKDAIFIVANHLNITRHAVYKSLREIKSVNPNRK